MEPQQQHVALVARVSTDHQDARRQFESVPKLAAEHYGSLPTEEYFEQEGVSATKTAIFERPEGKRLCEAIAAGRVAVVVADEQSRLVRGKTGAEWAEFYDLCESNGTTIHTVHEGILEAGETGELIGMFRAWANRREGRTRDHRVRGGKRTQSAAGYWPHGKTPLGYEATEAPDNPARKILRPSKDAPIVAEAFRLYDEDRLPLRDVGRYLSRELGRSFDKTYPRALLENPAYVGKVKCNGDVHEGRHPALVADDRFARIQERLRIATKDHHRAAKTWPFARYARCAACGSTLRFRTISPRDRKAVYSYVLCSNPRPRFPERPCPQPGIRAEVFEGQFSMALGGLAYGLLTRLRDDPSFLETDDPGASLASARATLDAASSRFRDLAQLVADDGITTEDERYQEARQARDAAAATVHALETKARSYEEELRALIETVEEVSDKAVSIEEYLADAERAGLDPEAIREELQDEGNLFVLRAAYGWHASDFATKRRIVEQLFESIVVSPDQIVFHLRVDLPDQLTFPPVCGTASISLESATPR